MLQLYKIYSWHLTMKIVKECDIDGTLIYMCVYLYMERENIKKNCSCFWKCDMIPVEVLWYVYSNNLKYRFINTL